MRTVFKSILIASLLVGTKAMAFGCDQFRGTYLVNHHDAFTAVAQKDTSMRAFFELQDKYVPDNRYENSQKTQALVDLVYRAFQETYPEFMKLKNKPTFALLESNDTLLLKAYRTIIGNTFTDGLIIIPDVVLSFEPTAQIGLLAHEMSHLFLNHYTSESKVLGFCRKNGLELTEHEKTQLQSYLVLNLSIGLLPIEETRGYPILGGLEEATTRALNFYELSRKARQCLSRRQKEIVEPRNRIVEQFNHLTDQFPVEDQKFRDEVSAQSQRLIETSKTCTAGENPFQFFDLKDETKKNLSEAGVTLPSEDTLPHLDDILSLGQRIIEKMTAINSELPIKDFNFYSIENQADEVATTILLHLNLPIESYASSYFDQENKKLIEECKSLITAGQEPGPGTWYDPHHSNCWRYKNILDFAKQYKTYPNLN